MLILFFVKTPRIGLYWTWIHDNPPFCFKCNRSWLQGIASCNNTCSSSWKKPNLKPAQLLGHRTCDLPLSSSRNLQLRKMCHLCFRDLSRIQLNSTLPNHFSPWGLMMSDVWPYVTLSQVFSKDVQKSISVRVLDAGLAAVGCLHAEEGPGAELQRRAKIGQDRPGGQGGRSWAAIRKLKNLLS